MSKRLQVLLDAVEWEQLQAVGIARRHPYARAQAGQRICGGAGDLGGCGGEHARNTAFFACSTWKR
jgi:hypothetical protein